MRRVKIQVRLKRTIAISLITAMTIACVGVQTNALAISSTSNTQESTSETEIMTNGLSENSSNRILTSYSLVSAGYSLQNYSGDDVVEQMKEVATGATQKYLTTSTENYNKSSEVLKLSSDDSAELKVTVPNDGLYFVKFNYYSLDESILPISMKMKVDGEYPFYECGNIKFETNWTLNSKKSYDRYGNQVVTIPDKVYQWEEKALMDGSYRHSVPLKVQLTKGTHVFKLDVVEGNFLLGNLILEAPSEVAAYTGSEKADGKEIIEVQGEEYDTTNYSSIHGVAEYDTAVVPHVIKDTVLNTLDSDSFDAAGQRVTYKFEVKKAGYYQLGMNYRQSEKTDFPVFVDVAVDGKIPNQEFQAYRMAYTAKYKTKTMKDSEGTNLSVYLEKGTHTVSYTISLDEICYILENIDVVMSNVNDLALEITKVAGTNADKYRDLKLSKYIPDLEDQLYSYADKLESLEKSAIKWSDSDKNVAVMSSMLIASKQLRSLADNPDEIPYRIGELSTSMNSVNHFLAAAVDNLVKNELAIDRIWIYQDGAKLPGKPGFFKSCWINLKRFAASFTKQAYSANNTDKKNIQVWVNRSSQYVQVMQKMIDEYFTPETGIGVDISIMPDQYKLVLANSSGNAPDVATGINYTIPYELGIRGALVDMAQFSDFKQAASSYEPGFFLTGAIENSVYSMPETMNFWVLYYRTDILDKLGLKVPNTMNDVIDMLPTLQMRGLNFYYPTAGMLLLRNFHGTTPLIVQNGGSLYNSTAAQGTSLGSEETVKGFTSLTELFTIYNMRINVDSFYQHFRNGDMPLGIADYATYNMLVNAAPELASSWKIALVPGTEQADGTINRSVCGCAESSVIFKSDSAREKKAWEFIKWWSSDEIQAKFGQTMQISFGDEYIWPTANMNAFSQLPLDASAKKVIEETAKNVVDVPRVPGTYLLEREMSNAFLDIVANGEDEQTRIDQAVKSVNHEFERKLEEFGYNDSDGNVKKEYQIPTIESVKELLGRTD